jgi:hypothetical protein
MRKVTSVENEKDYFLGKLVNPSITPTRGSAPGFTTLEYHSLTDSLKDVKQTFLDMESTIGKPKGSVFSDFEYLYVDYKAQYGLEQLTAYDISLMNKRLMADEDLYQQYIANKKGLTSTVAPTMDYYTCLQMNSMFMNEAVMCMEGHGTVQECEESFLQ